MSNIQCQVWRLEEIPEAKHRPYFLYFMPTPRAGQSNWMSRMLKVVEKRFGGGKYQLKIFQNEKPLKYMTFAVSGRSKYLDNCICDALSLVQIGCECGGE
jgi:hypothetical protein